jgi:hypothetical protein
MYAAYSVGGNCTMSFARIVSGAIILAGVQAVTGCASAPTEANAGPPPARYQEIVREHLRTSLFDPYSARDFQIAAPKPGQIHLLGTLTYESGWVVCYRGNAKNKMGAYTGIKEAVVLIREGRVVASNQDSDHYDVRTNCRDVRYEPLSLS